MNEVSLYNPLSVRGYAAGSTGVGSPGGSSSFAALLAMQMGQGAQQGVSAGAASSASYASLDASPVPFMLQSSLMDALSGASEGSGDTKDLILMLCLMMCNGSMGAEGGGMDSTLMMSLLSAMKGSSGLDTGVSGAFSASSLSAGAIADYTRVVSHLPLGTKGAAIVQAALTRLGDPYSKARRGTGDYVDCSSLVQWTYRQAGISIPGTAASQAKYCYEKGYAISKSDLQPGDLVFWSRKDCQCGRWNEVHHVGIYAGDGKVIEARTSAGCVVLDDLWGENGATWKITLYARPQ